jgi:poly(3-hydroxybutyrate) depolymerase
VTGGTDSGGAGGASTAAASTTGGTEPAPSAGCDSPAGLTSGPASIDVNGLMRDYILLVPDNYDPSHPYKLVFGFHPWGGSAQQTEQMGYFGIEDVSDGQAILVAPEGLDYQGNGLGWGNEDGQDVEFYRAMRDLFTSQLCIDQNRIFSTGFSFGAMFSFTLGCTQDSMIRAIAPQAGNAQVAGCENGDRSVATMAFIGTDDSLIDGHRQAVQTFVGRNGCSTEAVTLETSWCDGLGSEFEPCTCVEYPDCIDAEPVIECEYKAGHQFAPNSGETIWNFFSQF